MMSDVIRRETMVFLLAVLHGISLTAGYDVLRAFRRTVRHNLLAVSAEDFFFWLLAGFLTFCLAFLKTDGMIRGYVAFGIALGAVFYHYAASRSVVRILAWLMRKIRRMVGLLVRPVKKIVVFIRKKAYNGTEYQSNRKRKAVYASEDYESEDVEGERRTILRLKGVRQNGEKKKARKQK